MAGVWHHPAVARLAAKCPSGGSNPGAPTCARAEHELTYKKARREASLFVTWRGPATIGR